MLGRKEIWMKLAVMLLYFCLVLLIGGLGCWIALGQHLKHPTPESFSVYLGNLGTFSISVVVLAFADAIMNVDHSRRRVLLLFLFLVMMIALCLDAASLFFKETFMGWVALGAVLLTTIEWFVVNFHNPSFDRDEDARTTMGGIVSGS